MATASANRSGGLNSFSSIKSSALHQLPRCVANAPSTAGAEIELKKI